MTINSKRKQDGFTIIEVLIVLAIAATILLLVFLAVPALNRNSHNTKRSDDIAAIGGALSEYTNNANGVLPPDNATFKKSVITNAKLNFYDPASVTYKPQSGATVVAPPGKTVLDKVFVANYTKCLDAPKGEIVTTNEGATSRSVVALYRVEIGGSGDGQAECKEL